MYEKVHPAMVQQKANILLTMDAQRPATWAMHRMPIRQRGMASKANREVQD